MLFGCAFVLALSMLGLRVFPMGKEKSPTSPISPRVR